MAAEMHGWDGSTRFVFKTDRVGERGRAGRRTPWVGAATPWSRAVPKFLTTDRRGRRNPSCRELPWIPLSSPTSACRSGGGPPTRSHHHVGRNPQQHRSPYISPPAAGTCQPRSFEPAATRSPPELGGQDPPGNPRPLPAGQGAAAQGAGGPDQTLQHPAHRAGENRLAQDAAGTRAVSAALLPRPEAEGGLQDGAGPAQPRAEAHPRHGAGLAAGASGAGDDPDLPELPAGAGDVDGQARLRAQAGPLRPEPGGVPAPRVRPARQELDAPKGSMRRR